MPSEILIHPIVWPQYTNVKDRTDRQDRQRSDSTGRSVLQTFAQKTDGWLVGWSLTSLLSINTAISETNKIGSDPINRKCKRSDLTRPYPKQHPWVSPINECPSLCHCAVRYDLLAVYSHTTCSATEISFHMLSSSAKILKSSYDLKKLQTVKMWELFGDTVYASCFLAMTWASSEKCFLL